MITRVGGDGYLAAGPEQLYRAVPDEALHVPFSQVLYVGDGSSDIPAFALLHQEGGTAIGVRKPGGGREWDAGGVIDSTQRVDTQVAADYAPDSPLTRALTSRWTRCPPRSHSADRTTVRNR